ncbi:MAG: VCBS repeat-containing protein [Flammeovirgaceae bacterium]|nr:VCBS repeat-containing protein [Flammeovirgaceae bacterium]
MTNSFKSIGQYDLVENQRNIPDAQGGGNKFFINDNGKFRDYSAEANIYRSSIGFGLGITLGDFNDDTWTDIFISNDFFERDYLYINNQQGGFTESLTEYFRSISMGSMGPTLLIWIMMAMRNYLLQKCCPILLPEERQKLYMRIGTNIN